MSMLSYRNEVHQGHSGVIFCHIAGQGLFVTVEHCPQRDLRTGVYTRKTHVSQLTCTLYRAWPAHGSLRSSICAIL